MVLQKVKNELVHNPAVSLLGINPEEIKDVHRKIRILIALFIIAKSWNPNVN